MPPSPLLVPRRALAVLAALTACAVLTAAPVARADELQDVSRLLAAGRVDEAEKRADAYLQKTPKDAQMRFLKGVILAQRGKRDDAVTTFTAITQDYPELPEPYNNLAVIFAARGEYEKARTALESAVRVSPNYATAYENLGDVYAALAARSYQDARRHDANNAAALRKLDATRALLAAPSTGSSTASSSTPATPFVAAPSAPAAAAPAVPAEVIRSQRNVGLPSPAGPRVSVGGQGAVAPDIVVASNATSVPQGSNVVAIEKAPVDDDRAGTSALTGAGTVVAADPSEPIAAVTAAVRQWARGRSVTADDLRVRVDGDTAVARFRSTAQGARAPAPAERALTLRRSGGEWVVTGERAS